MRCHHDDKDAEDDGDGDGNDGGDDDVVPDEVSVVCLP